MTPRSRNSVAHREPGRFVAQPLVDAVVGRAARRVAAVDEVADRHARDLDRVLHGEEQAARGALPRREAEELLAVERDRAGGDRVVAAAHQHVRQRRLARAVRAHDRVHLARARARGRRRAGSRTSRSTPAARRSSAMLTTCSRDRHETSSPSTRTANTGTGWVAGRVCGSPVCERERRAVLRALDLTLVLPDVALGERVVGVGALVADDVPVVGATVAAGEADDAQPVAVDVEARRRSPPSRRPPNTPGSSLTRVGARSCGSTSSRRRPTTSADGQAVEDVVEEPEDDQPLGLCGRDAAALEVVELVVVDRADGARVRALHVVGLDLEVRDRLGARHPR